MDEVQFDQGDEPSRSGAGRTRRVLVGAAVAAVVAVGGLAVAAVNPLGIAGAQGDTTTTEAPAGPPTPGDVPSPAEEPPPAAEEPPPPPAADPPSGDTSEGSGRRVASKVLDDSLAALVADGTLTQAQADAVKAKVAATAAAMHNDRHAQGGRGPGMGERLDAAAAALGIDLETLRTELRSGKTLGQIAEAHGIDAAKVTDALVAAANERIDAAAAAGWIDSAKAAELKTRADEWIERLVTEGFRPGRR